MAACPPQLLREINASLAAIEAATNPVDSASAGAPHAGPLWGAMHKLLLKAKVDSTALMRMVGARDLAELRARVAHLRGEEPPPRAAPSPGAQADGDTAAGGDAGGGPAVDHATQQRALRAFRKRMALAQLDAESRLGVGPMSGGADQRIHAMEPPREFPAAVWEALVHAGKLRRAGQGLYSFVEEAGKARW